MRLRIQNFRIICAICSFLYIKSNIQNIPILHDVCLPFNTELSGFLNGGFRFVLQEVFGAHDFGADESTLQVGVNGASGDRSGVAHMNGTDTSLKALG